jgi:DNA-binding NtrC family response regulator
LQEKRLDGCPVFQADPCSPIFTELQSIVIKLTGPSHDAEIILVVEDQPATAQITRILLESWGYRVLEAHGAIEAMDIFERYRDTIKLLISDVIMPQMNGPELARELLRRRPDLRIVFMSGGPSEEVASLDQAFLEKPFNPTGLSRIVRQALERGR